MANEIFIQGKDLILSVHDGAAYRPVACVTASALNTALEILEVQTKCDPENLVRRPGVSSYDLSGDGVYIDTTSVTGKVTDASHDFLFDLQQAKSRVTWRLTTGLADTPERYGFGFFTDLTLDADVADNSVFSFTLSGDGAIVTVDPTLP